MPTAWEAMDVPDIPDTAEADMCLVTDNEGNRLWTKQLAYARKEEQVLIEETEITNTSTAPQSSVLPPQPFSIKEGDVVHLTFDGIEYETTIMPMSNNRLKIDISSVCLIVFTRGGIKPVLVNKTGKAGKLYATVITDKYYTIDPNFTPTMSTSGDGYSSVILTPYDLSGSTSSANGGYSVSSNIGVANGYASFAANVSAANGANSFANGSNTIANGSEQHAEGRYNIEDTENKYAHIVGNGYSNPSLGETIRSNAHTLDWTGNGWFSGDVYVGSTSGTNKDEGSKKLATEDFVRALIEEKLAELINAEEVSY